MRTAVRSLVATLLLGGVATSLSSACGSSSQATPTTDAALVDGGSSKKDGGIVDLDSDGGSRADAGNATPDGWATFDGIPNCPLTYPVRADAFPPPIKWVDCPASLNLPGACKRIALDFPDPAQVGPVLIPEGVVGGNLTFRLFHPTSAEWRTVDAAGASQMVLRTAARRCGPGSGGSFDGTYGLIAFPSFGDISEGYLLMGSPGKTPRIAERYTVPTGIVAFEQGIIEKGRGLHRVDWAGRDTLLANPNAPAFSDVGAFQEVGTRLYGRAGNPYNVYEYSTGTPKKIIQVGRDAGDVGAYSATDSRMFWTNIVADADNNGYSETALYTQELAADGSLTGTRQRLPLMGRQRWASGAMFGCNILARTYLNPRPIGESSAKSFGGGLEVFNFTTMRHWRLSMPDVGVANAEFFSAGEPYAVTCSEIVAKAVHFEPFSPALQQNFARFDLSKIGPGEPFAMTPDPVP